jgi:hypothetical protein
MAMWCAALALGGCGATVQQLKTRASIDLQCAEPRLQLKEVDAGTREVTGCGKRAIYVEIFNNSRHPLWLLNSELRDVPASSASR